MYFLNIANLMDFSDARSKRFLNPSKDPIFVKKSKYPLRECVISVRGWTLMEICESCEGYPVTL